MRLPETLHAINIGATLFADELRAQGADPIHLEWFPPVDGREESVLAMLETLVDDPMYHSDHNPQEKRV